MIRPRMPRFHSRGQGSSKIVPLGAILVVWKQSGTWHLCPQHRLQHSATSGRHLWASRACPASNQESSTQPLAREAGNSFRRKSRRRMGARRLARVTRDRRAWLGSGSRSKAPSWRGLPSVARSVLICSFTVHNEWLSAQGDVLGTKGAATFHGAVTEEFGAMLVPTQNWCPLG